MEIVANGPTDATFFLDFEGSSSIFVPGFVRAIKDRYEFWNAPNNMSEFDLSSGVEFNHGQHKSRNIGLFKIYNKGLFVRANDETAFLNEFIGDCLEFCTSQYDISVSETMPVSKRYVSTLDVKPSHQLLKKIQTLDEISAQITKTVSSYGYSNSTFSLSGLFFQPDVMKATPHNPGRFILERKVNTSNNDNIFFTEAPMSTDEHIKILELMERLL